MRALLPTLLLAGAVVPAQDPTPAKQPLLDGWMAEILDADLPTAREHYEAALAAEDLPNYQSDLAGLRLWEMTFASRERAKYRATVQARSSYVGRSTGIPFQRLRALSDLQEDFKAALTAKDNEELDRLRARLKEVVESEARFRSARGLVAAELVYFRGEQNAVVDKELERLRAQRKAALRAGEDRQAARLLAQIQQRQWAIARSASQRLVARRWTEMTRLHLAGQHERASGMERLLAGGPSRFGLLRRSSSASDLLGRIRRYGASRRESTLARVLENVDALQFRSELIPEERKILMELRARLDALGKEGKTEEALGLAARVPYRDELFRR